MKLQEAAKRVQVFEGASLTERLSELELSFKGLNRKESKRLCSAHELDSSLLTSAFEIKKLAGQINTLIHAAGILAALPSILEKSEVIESLSLGAGNTGKKFDLETDKRVAEFKFISWRGGAESIRQNSLFKDFYELAEHETDKEKYLYVLGLEVPLKFFNGGRSLKSVMSLNKSLSSDFFDKYGDRFTVVCDYFSFRKDIAKITDLIPVVPELSVL